MSQRQTASTLREGVGRAEIGAAWSKRSNEGRDYLSVKLDDPSFNAPIYANLFNDEDGETFTLIWSRGRKPSGMVGVSAVIGKLDYVLLPALAIFLVVLIYGLAKRRRA
jgi:hypothetical protein